MQDFVINVENYLSTIPQAAFTPDDVLRELVMNALQSCAIMKSREAPLSPLIRLEIPDGLRMQVTDNGIGFHPDVLSRLGELQTSKWPRAAELVGAPADSSTPYGRFGMGLTSTINICRELLIVSRPYTEGASATYYWWTDWASGWEMWADDQVPATVPAETVAVASRTRLDHTGASVLLTFKDEAWAGPEPWTPTRLEKLVRYYFSAVTTPIHVGVSDRPCNASVKGWPTDGDQRSAQTIVKDWLASRGYDGREGPESPYHCYPIQLFDGISGVIWYSRAVSHDTVHFFAHEVYASRLEGLLPSGGGFISAIVNDQKAILDIQKKRPQVTTLAGQRREETIRSAISSALTAYVGWLNSEFERGTQKERDTILSIGRGYGLLLLSYLLRGTSGGQLKTAEAAFEWVPVPTFRPRGTRTLPECTAKGGDGGTPIIYYVGRETNLARSQLFTQEIIVDAREEYCETLLRLYQNTNAPQTGLEIREVSDPVTQIRILSDAEVVQANYDRLQERLSTRWFEGDVAIGDVPSQLGVAFAYVIDSPEGKRLIVNKNNEAMDLVKSLTDGDLETAAAHVADFSLLLLSSQIEGPEYDNFARHFGGFVTAVARLSGTPVE